MSFASAGASKIAYKLESSYGVNPGGNFKFLRYISDGFRHNVETAESQEVTPDRLPSGGIRVNVGSRGPFGVEFAPNDFDDFIQGLMMNTWSSSVALTAQTITITGSSGTTATLTDGATSGAFTNIVVGQWIEIGGFETSGNNGFVRVTAKASNDAVTIEGLTFANETGDTDITVTGRGIVPGSTKTSLAVEKQFTDATTPTYVLALGCMVNSMSLSARSRGIVSANFDLIGKLPASADASGAGTPTSAGTDRAANTVENVGHFREGTFGAESSLKITDLSLEISNNLQDLPAFGTLGPVDLALGRMSLRGRFSAYFENKTLANKLEAATESALSVRFAFASGEHYIFTLPAVDILEYDALVPGIQGAIVQNVGFFAKKDTNGVAFRVDGPF